MNNLGFTNIYTRIMGVAISHNNTNSNSNNDPSSKSQQQSNQHSSNISSSPVVGKHVISTEKNIPPSKQETPVMNFVLDDDEDDDSSHDLKQSPTTKHSTGKSGSGSGSASSSKKSPSVHANDNIGTKRSYQETRPSKNTGLILFKSCLVLKSHLHLFFSPSFETTQILKVKIIKMVKK